DKLAARFPGLHVVHMHRDPRTTIASGASLNATLHAMHADTVDVHRVGAQWLARMGWTNDRAMSARDGWARQTGGEATVVTDIGYDEAVADPIGQVAHVYDAIGLPLIDAAEDAMRRWLHERPREAVRPPYGLDNYGLLPEQVDERFDLYNKRFEQHIGGTAHA
ncbi:sulfotransferase, partial [Mycobacterium montefiorense]